jgi:hypothetical protein
MDVADVQDSCVSHDASNRFTYDSLWLAALNTPLTCP